MKIWDDETPDLGNGKTTPAQQLDMLSDRIGALEARESAIAKRLRRLELLQRRHPQRIDANSTRGAS